MASGPELTPCNSIYMAGKLQCNTIICMYVLVHAVIIHKYSTCVAPSISLHVNMYGVSYNTLYIHTICIHM